MRLIDDRPLEPEREPYPGWDDVFVIIGTGSVPPRTPKEG
jgi:hypothetical protein